ncbi:hypothetical protein H6P81_007416 [Aristolochia fimbriata]|uniref:Uncharacterized protein n=1 Tax=Aristolochia fimbriata TaxID=158543 RepID=A0AAV7F3I6_ARIFI|nr:hypothetical protein H6P81_007416 [Aristolochia fimbriata]
MLDMWKAKSRDSRAFRAASGSIRLATEFGLDRAEGGKRIEKRKRLPLEKAGAVCAGRESDARSCDY